MPRKRRGRRHLLDYVDRLGRTIATHNAYTREVQFQCRMREPRESAGWAASVDLLESIDEDCHPVRLRLVGGAFDEVDWDIVMRFAADVAEHGRRSNYWTPGDRRVLIPWDAFDGGLTDPVPPTPEQEALW